MEGKRICFLPSQVSAQCGFTRDDAKKTPGGSRVCARWRYRTPKPGKCDKD